MLGRALMGGTAAGATAVLVWMQTNYSHPKTAPLPAGSGVVVVGGGIVGTTTAYELAEAGYKVTLLESSQAVCDRSASASWGNACTIGRYVRTHPLTSLSALKGVMFSTHLTVAPVPASGDPADPATTEMHEYHSANKFFKPSAALDPYFWMWGLAFLRQLAAPQTMLDAHWQRMIDDDHDALFEVARREGIEDKSGMGHRGRLVVQCGPRASVQAVAAEEEEEARRHEPFLFQKPNNFSVLRSTAFPADSQGNCASYARNLIAVAQKKHGVCLRLQTRVAKLSVGDGKMDGVWTDAGEFVPGDAVVLCAGASTPCLLRSVGVYAPIHPLRGYSITVEVKEGAPLEHLPRGSVVLKPYQLYITPFEGKQIRFTSYGEFTGMGAAFPPNPTNPTDPTNPSPAPQPADKALQAKLESLVTHVLPQVEDICEWPTRQHWVGSRPLTPDAVPIIGPTCVPGLFLNAGHSHEGWRRSQNSARVLAHQLRHGSEAAPLREYQEVFSMSRWQPF